MTKPRITPALKEQIAELREGRGWSYQRIGRKIGLSEGAVSWHCLMLGIEPPQACQSWPVPRGPLVMKRGNHLLRRFTPDEDARLLALEAEGKSRNAIGRAIGRRPNSVTGRLATLARREARRELHQERGSSREHGKRGRRT
jgi:hypothetical protein